MYIEVESCLQVVVEVAVRSHAGLQAAHGSGLLPAFLAELFNYDILLQMNALELVTKLAMIENGLQYLRQRGVLTALANRVTALSEDPLASLTLPGDLLHTVCVLLVRHVCRVVKSDCYLCDVCLSVHPSARNSLAPTEQNFMNIGYFFY
jgi:hypothetical protein